MTNEQIYVFISIGLVLFIGSWALVIAVMLDKARAEIKKLKQEIQDLIPF
jgi:hypothetical protein